MPLKELPALAQDCVDDNGRVTAMLSMHMNGVVPTMHGEIQAQVRLICQRCLEPVVVELAAKTSLGFVQTEEQAALLPSDLEPFLYEEEEIPLSSVLEQELLLALPIVAYHDQCSHQSYEPNEQEVTAAEPKQNPFAVLEQLKGKGQKSDT